MFQGIKLESVAENECTCIVGIFSTQHWSLPSYPESSFQWLKKLVKVVRYSWLCETQSGSLRELVEKNTRWMKIFYKCMVRCTIPAVFSLHSKPWMSDGGFFLSVKHGLHSLSRIRSGCCSRLWCRCPISQTMYFSKYN